MSFTYDARLPGLLNEIETELLAQTPGAVAKLKVRAPVYALFLWYHDSSTDGDLAPQLGLGVESLRETCRRNYPDAASANDCIWRPQQVVSELIAKLTTEITDKTFVANCNAAYALMLSANDSDLPLADEGEIVRPFRTLLHRVARKLNERSWAGIFPTTDDFVVVAMDTIGYWFGEDLKASVPEAKYELLERRGLLFDS